MIPAEKYVEQAQTGKYLGISYDKLDCQAFVEKVLSDAGEKGHDWRGTNDMWRNALTVKRDIVDIADIPAGAWVFTLKHDGGEKDRGYYDDEGNATHVGIYLGAGSVMHSTKTATANGVQLDMVTSSRWTHYGLCKYINFGSGEDAENLRDLVKRLGTVTIYDLYQAMRDEWG